MQYITITSLALLALLCTSCGSGPEPVVNAPVSSHMPGKKIAPLTGAGVVTVVGEDGRYALLRDGQPYVIKGAGVGYDHIESFAEHGGNSIRTWDPGQRYLDKAAELGLTVAMGLRIGLERKGFDYDDEQAVATQLETVRAEILKYKDHPALLTWIIGNEANLQFKNPKLFDAVNGISKMIHAVDGKHPTTMSLAGFNPQLAHLIETRAPDLDFVSIQLYHGMFGIQDAIEAMDYTRPYFITEWGSMGHWEVNKTAWGAPIEQTSSEKAQHYLDSYEKGIASNPGQVMGGYVFVWGQKQERTPTWYGMFLQDGTETETIDVLHHIWNGTWPANRAPHIKTMLLNAKTSHQDVMVNAGGGYEAEVVVSDVDGDDLAYRWVIMRESTATQTGGDREVVPVSLDGLVENTNHHSVKVTAPAEPGAYRLFVYVYDNQGHAAHANIPFYAESP